MPHPSPDDRLGQFDKHALTVREGLPDKWHYTIAVDDSRPELAAAVTVMFDGLLRCELRMTRLGHDQDAAVRTSRLRVLEWIGDYLHRHPDPEG
jgi:hypothetical protein